MVRIIISQSKRRKTSVRPMKRKIEIGLLIAVIALGIAAIILTNSTEPREQDSSPRGGKEIAIRNVTHSRIHYRIKPHNSLEEPENKTIEPDDIHRYTTLVILKLMFDRVEGEEIRQLSPGRPYAFRYDENNLIQFYEGSHGQADAVDLAPFVPTPMMVVEKMLELAEVDSKDILYDIGCGDGRIVITAAKKYGARGVGIDIDPKRIRESNNGAKSAGVEKLVEFRLGDATKMDVSEATVVTLYLLPESNALLRPQLEKQLKKGAYVVSHNYQIQGWEDKEIDYTSIDDDIGENHTIFLYRR